MRRSDQDRLLRDVLADESLARLRQDSLASGLTSLRQRRRRRTLLATAASLALMLTVLFVAQRRPAIPAAPAAAVAKTSHVKFINDEQLFALFPGRPAALIGSPGAQKFIFLDAPIATSAPLAKP